MKGIRIGNSVIDREAVNDTGKIALEIKSGHDDVIRGIGVLSKALASRNKTIALVTSVQHAKRIKPNVFRNELVILARNRDFSCAMTQ